MQRPHQPQTQENPAAAYPPLSQGGGIVAFRGVCAEGLITHRTRGAPMSVQGQKQTLSGECSMSARPSKADIRRRGWDVRQVPLTEVAPRKSATLIRSLHRRGRGATEAR